MDDFAKSLEAELMKYTADYEDEKIHKNSEPVEAEHSAATECSTSFDDSDCGGVGASGEADVLSYVGGGEAELMKSDYEDEKIHKNSEPVEAEHSDATAECSASFDDSDCGGVDASDEAEVLSYLGRAESSSVNLHAKRRKLSSHWRAFIHPLMWRCKWVELQMSKLDAQARAYDRKLQGCAASEEVVWRKRRQRADVAAYMSRHNLFSYYEHRKSICRIAHNVLKNHPAVGKREEVDELGNDEGGEHDEALEEILRKIEALQWRVRKLKSKVVEYEKEEEEEEEDELAWMQSGAPPSSTTTRRRMPVTTNYIASQLLAEYNLGGVLLPGATHHHPPQNELVEGEEEDEDDVLIDNHRVREELRYFKRVKKVHSNSNLTNASKQSKRGKRK